MKTIPIRKDLLPYKFDFEVKGKLFKIRIKSQELYNNFISIDLFNELDELIVGDETAKYLIPLWDNLIKDDTGNFNPIFPQAYFQFLSPDGLEYPITFDNLEDKVFLTVSDFVT